jgi:DNA-binding NarL/FixJ family response regulator
MNAPTSAAPALAAETGGRAPTSRDMSARLIGNREAAVGADYLGLSPVLVETCGALALSLREGDLVAAERLFGFVADQLPDRRAVLTDVLAPLVAQEVSQAPTAQSREMFIETCHELLQRLRRPVASHAPADTVLLYAWCRCEEALFLQMAALLLDDAHVPATVLMAPDETVAEKQALAMRAPVTCIGVCDVDQLLRAEPTIRALRCADTAVVLLGEAVDPTLPQAVGATAGASHVGEVADLLQRLRGPLTAAEAEVLRLAADGYTNVRIAHELDLSVSAVKARLEAGYAKLEASDRAHAVAIALRRHWIR